MARRQWWGSLGLSALFGVYAGAISGAITGIGFAIAEASENPYIDASGVIISIGFGVVIGIGTGLLLSIIIWAILTPKIIPNHGITMPQLMK